MALLASEVPAVVSPSRQDVDGGARGGGRGGEYLMGTECPCGEMVSLCDVRSRMIRKVLMGRARFQSPVSKQLCFGTRRHPEGDSSCVLCPCCLSAGLHKAAAGEDDDVGARNQTPVPRDKGKSAPGATPRWVASASADQTWDARPCVPTCCSDGRRHAQTSVLAAVAEGSARSHVTLRAPRTRLLSHFQARSCPREAGWRLSVGLTTDHISTSKPGAPCTRVVPYHPSLHAL